MNETQRYMTSERVSEPNETYIAGTSECIWYVIHNVFYMINVTLK